MSVASTINELGPGVAGVARHIVSAYHAAGLLSIPAIITCLILFALQRRFPVSRPGKGAYAMSAAWTLIGAPITAVALALEFVALAWLFRGPLSWSGFDALHTWPIMIRVLLGLLVVDAADYWSHRLRHAVPVLWRFHSIHHAAPHMSFWSTLRSHPIDVVLASTVRAIPLLIAQESAMVFGAVFGIRSLLFYCIHSNVRVRLGRVDAFAVTPQWHRLHHSVHPEHHDRNFGAT